MMKTILTPIDGSEHAKMALDLGADLAAKYGAKLVVVHVGDLDEDVPEELYAAAENEFAAAESRGDDTGVPPHHSRRHRVLQFMGQTMLGDARTEAKNRGVEDVDTIMDYGDPALRILHHAKEASADLIVMGSRGLGRLAELVLGSVSHKVFNLAPCSSITVHPGKGRVAVETVKNLVVATDGSAVADKAVGLASDVAAKYGAEVTFVYVMNRGPSLEQLRSTVDMDQLSESARNEIAAERHPIAEHVTATMFPPVVAAAALKEIGEQVLARAQKMAADKGVAKADAVLKDGDPARVIVGVAKHGGADLIAMGSRGLGGAQSLLAGSVSYKVNHSAPCSCMIVR